jgi:hypothetical protein
MVGKAKEMLQDNMNSVSAAMEESTVNLDMIASASEEMGSTIKEIAENSSRARVTTEEAVVSALKSHAGIQELGAAARAIGTITETITEISEQTNLLELNATIEAARSKKGPSRSRRTVSKSVPRPMNSRHFQPGWLKWWQNLKCNSPPGCLSIRHPASFFSLAPLND